jgi:hypothetical protein
VRLTEVGTPVTSPDGQNAQLGNDNGGTDGSSDFLGSLDSQTDVALTITNDNDGLETGTLTSTGLLLDRLDLLMEYISASRPASNLISLNSIFLFMRPSSRSIRPTLEVAVPS